MWARTYNGHLPKQYIDELRELIKAGFPEKSTDRRYSAVVLLRYLRSGASILFHRSEFIAIKYLLSVTISFLFEDDTSLTAEPDQQSDDGKEPRAYSY